MQVEHVELAGRHRVEHTEERVRRPKAAREVEQDPAVREARRVDLEDKIHRVGPDFGSTLTVSNRDFQSNCWVNWKLMGQPCEFQVQAEGEEAEAFADGRVIYRGGEKGEVIATKR